MPVSSKCHSAQKAETQEHPLRELAGLIAALASLFVYREAWRSLSRALIHTIVTSLTSTSSFS
jgi:hypothetical protein